MRKISFVCTTFRRYRCVERIISQYYAQSYPNKELIILNTDMDYPMTLGFEDDSIILINNDKNYETGEYYKNRGEICRDAVTHATGDYFLLADDDDIYLPWHMQQAYDGITKNGKDAWKPEMSFYSGVNELKLVKNTLEASVIVKMSRIREIGFTTGLTGYEGLKWYEQLRNEGNLQENEKEYVPSYCFNWSDPSDMAGHKQSGDISNPLNFENHKRESKDFAKLPLIPSKNINEVYKKYFDFIRDNRQIFHQDSYNKYVTSYI